MESNLVEIEMFDSEGNGILRPFIKVRISDGNIETREFYMRVDTGADMTIVPASYVKMLDFTLYNSPVTLQWGNGDTTEHITPWTGFIRFSNGAFLRATRGLIINEEGKTAFLGMDILRQGTLFLTPKGGYFLIGGS